MIARQAIWQIHIPLPKEIKHPHYDVTKPNEQHQFNFLYVPHNAFEGNTNKYVLTDVDFTRPIRTKKSSEVVFALEAIYKKCCVFKYPKVFQCEHTHTAFVKAFDKELEK